jgi:hypothetical protein
MSGGFVMLRHVILRLGESGFEKTTFLHKCILEGTAPQCSRDLGLILNCRGDNTRKSGVIMLICMLN